jgi:hypothetical protein
MLFHTEVESRYFNAFRYEFGPSMSTVLASSIWDRIVLQACHSEPFVRECVVALAALGQSLLTCLSDSYDVHYQFALSHYSKAIRDMRNSLANKDLPFRNALIGCLLVFCFEGIQGNQEVAISHAQNGYKLLQAWLATAHSKSTSAEVAFYSAPQTIDDELIQVFKHLDLQIMTVSNSRNMELHLKGKMEDNDAIEGMPQEFSTVGEAHRYWELIMRRCAHLVHSVALFVGAGIEQPSQVAVTLGTFRRVSSPLEPVPSSLYNDYSKHLGENLRWQAALDPLLASTDPKTKPTALFLKCLAVSTRLVLESLLIKKECEYDQYLPQYVEMVALARLFLSNNEPGPPKQSQTFFSIDFGLIPSLFITVKQCRDCMVRREALGLLRSNPRREGVWDGLLIAGIGQWLMDVEEEGLEGEFVPEHARVKLTRVDVDIATKTARLECTRMDFGNESEVILQTSIRWSC